MQCGVDWLCLNTCLEQCLNRFFNVNSPNIVKISRNFIDSFIFLVIIVPEGGHAATRAHVREVEGEVWVEAEVEDVEEAEGDDRDPDRKTEVRDHEGIEVGFQADVLGMLDQ